MGYYVNELLLNLNGFLNYLSLEIRAILISLGPSPRPLFPCRERKRIEA